MHTGHIFSSLQTAAGAATQLSSGLAVLSPILLGSPLQLGSYSIYSNKGLVMNSGVVLSTGSLLRKSGDDVGQPGLSDLFNSHDATVLQYFTAPTEHESVLALDMQFCSYRENLLKGQVKDLAYYKIDHGPKNVVQLTSSNFKESSGLKLATSDRSLYCTLGGSKIPVTFDQYIHTIEFGIMDTIDAMDDSFVFISTVDGPLAVHEDGVNYKEEHQVAFQENWNRLQKRNIDLGLPITLSNSLPVTLSTSLPVTLPTSLPVTLPTSLPVTLPTSLPVTLPTSLPVTLPTSLPVTLPTSLPVTLPTSLPVTLPTTLPVTLPISLPVTLPISLPVTLPTSLPITLPTSLPITLSTSLPISIPTSIQLTLPISLPITIPTTASVTTGTTKSSSHVNHPTTTGSASTTGISKHSTSTSSSMPSASSHTGSKKSNGHKCHKNIQCKSDVCHLHRCVPQKGTGKDGSYCNALSQCSSDLFCSVHDKCSKKHKVGGTCNANSTCASGHCHKAHCVHRKGHGVVGSYCNKSSQCISGWCSNWKHKCETGRKSRNIPVEI